jgi:hypothetical protein
MTRRVVALIWFVCTLLAGGTGMMFAIKTLSESVYVLGGAFVVGLGWAAGQWLAGKLLPKGK